MAQPLKPGKRGRTEGGGRRIEHSISRKGLGAEITWQNQTGTSGGPFNTNIPNPSIPDLFVFDRTPLG
eukprot:1372827-Pyramimonas_sp.AAC.1